MSVVGSIRYKSLTPLLAPTLRQTCAVDGRFATIVIVRSSPSSTLASEARSLLAIAAFAHPGLVAGLLCSSSREGRATGSLHKFAGFSFSKPPRGTSAACPELASTNLTLTQSEYSPRTEFTQTGRIIVKTWPAPERSSRWATSKQDVRRTTRAFSDYDDWLTMSAGELRDDEWDIDSQLAHDLAAAARQV